MTSTDFTEISRRYERDSLVQKAAAEVLLGLLQVGPREDVLDLGCGTGHLTERLAALTTGRVLGVDPSAGMIAEARARHGSERVRFEVGGAEELALDREVDAIGGARGASPDGRDPGAGGVRSGHRALGRARSAPRRARSSAAIRSATG